MIFKKISSKIDDFKKNAPPAGPYLEKWINNMMSSGQDFTISLIDEGLFVGLKILKKQEKSSKNKENVIKILQNSNNSLIFQEDCRKIARFISFGWSF